MRISLTRMAWRYVWSRPLVTAATIAGVALGAALITGILSIREASRRALVAEAAVFDVVVGAPGGRLQLVLSSVYHLDQPTGNIPYRELAHWRRDPRVKLAMPIALGDNVGGFRIVGTDAALFEARRSVNPDSPPLLELAEGRAFESDFDAVLGSTVARELGARLGDTFVGSHGLEAGSFHAHDSHPYTVVGILAPSGTANDRAVFVPYESVWAVHGGHGDHDHGDDEYSDHEHEGHDHVDHDHAHDADESHDHDHEGHNHADYDHEGHDHDGHDHTSDSHADHDHDGHDHAHDERTSAKAHDHDHDHEEHEHARDDHAHAQEENVDQALPAFLAGPPEESVDDLNDGDDRELTAILLQLESPGARAWVADEANSARRGTVGAIPLGEARRLTDNFLAPFELTLLAVAWLVVAVAALSVMATLYQSAERRRREMGLLRCMGARPREVAALLLLEAALLCIVGVALGLGLGMAGVSAIGSWIGRSTGFGLQGAPPLGQTATALGVVLVAGVAAGLIPALRARSRPALLDLESDS